MTNSKLTIDGTDYEFQGDERYTPAWALAQSQGIRGVGPGQAVVSAAKISTIIYTISGYVISSDSVSADKALHNLIDALANNIQTGTTSTCELVVGNGTIVLTGWPTNLQGPRDAPKGEARILISFDFACSALPNHSALT